MNSKQTPKRTRSLLNEDKPKQTDKVSDNEPAKIQKRISKKPCLLHLHPNLHAALSDLVYYDKKAGDSNASITSYFFRGLDKYLRERNLPNVKECEEGVEITPYSVSR